MAVAIPLRPLPAPPTAHRPQFRVNGAQGRVVLCPMRNLMLFKRPRPPKTHILPQNRVESAAHIYEDELFHHETGGHEEEQMLEQQRNYLHRDYVLIKRAECNK